MVNKKLADKNVHDLTLMTPHDSDDTIILTCLQISPGNPQRLTTKCGESLCGLSLQAVALAALNEAAGSPLQPNDEDGPKNWSST